MPPGKYISIAALILASINTIMLSGVAFYLIEIDAIGSRTSIEALSVVALALLLFVIIPLKFMAMANKPQLENASKDRITLRILAFILLLMPPVIFTILLSRELSSGRITSHEQRAPDSTGVI